MKSIILIPTLVTVFFAGVTVEKFLLQKNDPCSPQITTHSVNKSYLSKPRAVVYVSPDYNRDTALLMTIAEFVEGIEIDLSGSMGRVIVVHDSVTNMQSFVKALDRNREFVKNRNEQVRQKSFIIER